MITIIPALDIISGKCVRLEQGRFNTIREYNSDPVEIAWEFEHHGLTRLHLVDLDGARQGKIVNWQVLEKIAKSTKLIIDFSGGIRSRSDLKKVFDCGAKLATVGSIAVTDRVLFKQWLADFGSDKIVLAADFFKSFVRINAWEKETEIGLQDFLLDYRQDGIRNVICTDITKDGLLQGPAFEIYGRIKESLPGLYLIASGGVASLEHVRSLDRLGVDAVIIGKALYEGKIHLKELTGFIC